MQLETNQRLELTGRAAALTRNYERLRTHDLLRGLLTEDYPGRIGLVSSFGAEAAVTLHMVAEIDPYTPVIFLDTWKHFPETLAYRDDLVTRLGLCNMQTVTPRPVHLEVEDPDGNLSARDPDRCCHFRKTRPMLQALRAMDCWITGRKRHQADTRSELTLFEVQDRWIKVNPLLDWSPDDVAAYYRTHDLPPHPLTSQGYPSIGCVPCTRPVAPGEDARAGRWSDSEKTECGIHFENGKIVRGGT